MRKARTIYLVTAMLLGLSVFVLCIASLGSTARGPIALTFTRFVNVRRSSDAPSGKVAAFVLTNGTPTDIFYRAQSIEHRTEDGWVTNSLSRTPEEWRNFGVTLGPFESRELLVPSPDIRVWRLRLVGNQRATGINGLIDRLRDFRDFFDWKRGGLTGERFEGRSFQIVS